MLLVFELLGMVGLLVAAGATYQAIGSALDRRRHLPPGRMVSIGTHRLHVLSAGSGAPTVVFEAALGASSISWARVQPKIAELTGTCSYDRAGMGFSELGPEPRSAQRIVEEMHGVLETAEVPKPYLLVGHSYGGMTCRLFAAHYPNEVVGLVLLDPADPQSWSSPSELQRRKLWAGALLARQGAVVARLGIARATAALVRLGAHRAARATAVAMSGGLLAGNTDRLIAPIDRVPPELRPVAAGFWIQPRFYESLASQIRFMPESAAQVAATTIPSNLPLTVLSAASLPAPEMEQNKLLASKSAHGRHIVVPGSGHWIQLDQPEVVIRAIAEMLGELRKR